MSAPPAVHSLVRALEREIAEALRKHVSVEGGTQAELSETTADGLAGPARLGDLELGQYKRAAREAFEDPGMAGSRKELRLAWGLINAVLEHLGTTLGFDMSGRARVASQIGEATAQRDQLLEDRQKAWLEKVLTSWGEQHGRFRAGGHEPSFRAVLAEREPLLQELLNVQRSRFEGASAAREAVGKLKPAPTKLPGPGGPTKAPAQQQKEQREQQQQQQQLQQLQPTGGGSKSMGPLWKNHPTIPDAQFTALNEKCKELGICSPYIFRKAGCTLGEKCTNKHPQQWPKVLSSFVESTTGLKVA